MKVRGYKIRRLREINKVRKKEASHKYFRDAVLFQIGMDPPSLHQLTQQTNKQTHDEISLIPLQTCSNGDASVNIAFTCV